MTNPVSLLTLAHQCVAAHLPVGAIAIDATTGNGHDSVFLAQRVGPTGLVYGFDLQATALEYTRQRLQQAKVSTTLQLIHASHARMAEFIAPAHQGKVHAIMFNLGYLPGGDKTLITDTPSTLSALAQALPLLAPAGILTILAYPGHAGGAQETAAVADWFAQLSATHFATELHLSQRHQESAPRLFCIKKLAENC